MTANSNAGDGRSADVESFAARLTEYLEWLRTKNYAKATLKNRELYLGYFVAWCGERGLGRPQDVTRPILERYARYLYYYRTVHTGRPLSFRSQHARLVPVRAFFKWLTRQNYLLSNPASELDLPKLGRSLPKHVLSISEVERIMNSPDMEKDLGVRDRAILETFYSTGMRRKELLGLRLYDVDIERGTVMIRQGKGRKDRMVPIGERALDAIDKYVIDVRPKFVCEPDDRVVFLTTTGKSFIPTHLTQLVRGYVIAADLGKVGACHLFRHTMATLMLEGGADVRFIQQMLGHANLETTQIYTHVAIRQLKEIHAATHPSARRGRRADLGEGESAEETARDADAAELLTALAAENDEESVASPTPAFEADRSELP